jgi:hypothetical protein
VLAVTMVHGVGVLNCKVVIASSVGGQRRAGGFDEVLASGSINPLSTNPTSAWRATLPVGSIGTLVSAITRLDELRSATLALAVERGFNRLKQWRGVATRYDKYALTYLGGVLLACAVVHARVGSYQSGDTP